MNTAFQSIFHPLATSRLFGHTDAMAVDSRPSRVNFRGTQ